ncbi:uncharacterized protein TNIN_151991 [Trichonephila inaurata madagascariensis]|uniref:Uncharacterized protein n=1 Tax=Trichonephila inaurata madagascariensis TaxID=2747483 RepID=A0A8X7BP42_9ARAC|nr:uncharacterized protein TNIN_151991 [Trichonephila inaurata madagascariensis]
MLFVILLKVVIFCAALAAAHASLVGPLGYGAPVLAAGPLGLGLGKGLIGAPAIATTSSQRTAINHVAPAAPLGLAAAGLAAPLAVAAPLAAAAPLAYGNGVIAGNGILANGVGLGLAGHGLAAPLAYGNGVIAGNGILANGVGLAGHGLAAPLAIGNGLLGAPYGLGVGKLGLGLGLGKAIL